MANPVILTSDEAADALGVTGTTVHRWVRSGRIKPLRTAGNAWVFSAEEVARVNALPKPRRGRPPRSIPQAPQLPVAAS